MSCGDQRQCNAYQHFLIATLLLVAFYGERIAVAGQTNTNNNNNKKCAEVNEYCQNHWDCCSNSCMSYLYRCVRSYQNIYPYPFLGVTRIPTVTLEDILAQHFGPQAAAEPAAATQMPGSNGPRFESRFNGDDNTISKIEDDKDVKVDIVLQEQQQQKLPAVMETTTTLGDSEAIATTTEGVKEPCKEIGSKCYNDNECCTQRCHGFLHKCVT